MGNTFARNKTAKVMKVDGETLKFPTPVLVSDVIRQHPDHVLMDSEAVRLLGVKAQALALDVVLKPKRIYFLVQLPKTDPVDKSKAPRRVRSGNIHMSAKDRLESLALSRRSASDLSHVRLVPQEAASGEEAGGAIRVKMRLPKAQVSKLMEESKDATEVAEKIVGLCIPQIGEDDHKWAPSLGNTEVINNAKHQRKVKVRFQPVQNGELD